MVKTVGLDAHTAAIGLPQAQARFLLDAANARELQAGLAGNAHHLRALLRRRGKQ